MAKENAHIFLRDTEIAEAFTTPKKSRKKEGPQRNRKVHSHRLQQEWAAIWARAKEQETSRMAVSMPSKDGVYVEFEGAPGHDLMIKSLEDRSSGIRLLNVYRLPGKEQSDVAMIRATVFIPSGKQKQFLKKLEQYAEEETAKGKPRHARLVESVESVRLAVLESFWRDDLDLRPKGTTAVWCEIWLRGTGQEIETHFRETAAALNLEIQAGVLRFPERTVVLGRATLDQLDHLVEFSSDIAEFKRAKETARFFLELGNKEQSDWVNDLLSRLEVKLNAEVVVCVLDTGANNGHPLLSPILSDSDCHTVDPEWGINDHDPIGHGTLMCGVAAYGDLLATLDGRGVIQIQHCLESVKILPPAGQNNPRLYGAITIQGMSRAEIQEPMRTRIGCMAVTTEDGRDRGKPSSWSAAIDQFTSGYSDDNRSLFIVAAGNVMDQIDWADYPESNLSNSVHDPGQSWNALTVGAYTEKVLLSDPTLQDYVPLAQHGELSPFSTTSLTWGDKWPIKPDLVLEGGNLAKGPDGFISEFDDLSLLSTGHHPTQEQLNPICATSAAVGQAAWIACQIQARYPQAWPETIRALMIHSAEWPHSLKKQFLKTMGKSEFTLKSDYGRLLRFCGYGVPNLAKSLATASNSLTLISESVIQPFEKKIGKSSLSTKEMHLHRLPWPRDVLLSLGEAPVTLRVTLSYFIEPGPGEIGWKNRYRYSSYALRFDLNNTGEDEVRFMKRLNAAAREEGEDTDNNNDTKRWLIGSTSRERGSVHSDIWEGTAADIATCNLIGVYPVIGWWRERAWLGRGDRKARYSLVVSLQTPDEQIDIYTPVAIQLEIPVGVTI